MLAAAGWVAVCCCLAGCVTGTCLVLTCRLLAAGWLLGACLLIVWLLPLLAAGCLLAP